MSVVIVSLSQGDVLAAALQRDWQTHKVLNHMSLNVFQPLAGPATPSIQC